MRSILRVLFALFTVSLFWVPTAFGCLDYKLVAYYPFNGNANDLSGNINDGLVYGATLVEDRFGISQSAYYFDGVDDFIQVLDDPSLDFGIGDYSITLWIKTTQDGLVALVDKRDILWLGPFDALSWGYGMFHWNGKPGVQIGTEDWTNYYSNNTIGDGNWHFLAVTVDRDKTDGIRFYVDGTLVFVGDPTPYKNQTIDNSSDLLFGKEASDVSWMPNFKGTLDSIRLYNRVINSYEVDELFNDQD